ncbi:MAG: hypothetical protein AAF236_10430 [Verrucomicrobiota bacterium]
MNPLVFALAGLIAVMTTSCIKDSGSKPGEWHFTNFSEVRAFRLNWEDEDAFDRILDQDGNLNPTRLPKDGVVLTDAQITALEAAVTGEHPDHPVAACFYPHHAFIFYGETGEIIGHINICFLCSNYSGDPPGFASNWNLAALRDIFDDIGMPLSNPDWN